MIRFPPFLCAKAQIPQLPESGADLKSSIDLAHLQLAKLYKCKNFPGAARLLIRISPLAPLHAVVYDDVHNIP